MTIARDDSASVRGNGALQNAVIIRIVGDAGEGNSRVDPNSEPPERPSSSPDLFCAPSEFDSENAINLGLNGWREIQRANSSPRQIEHFTR